MQFFNKNEDAGGKNLVKVIAVSTKKTYSWKMLHIHTLPDHFDKYVKFNAIFDDFTYSIFD